MRLGKSLIFVQHISEPYLWYEVQVFPLGSGDKFIIMAQDITKHNEEKIRIENVITSNKIANESLIYDIIRLITLYVSYF